jgi:hypothetical protein
LTWLAELFDGVTRRHFDRLGVAAGWRCWEVGAGGPSIPEALATAVGPTGYVLATDINPAWLDPHGGYAVLRHDIVGDPPPQPGTFDLVRARLVLVHVKESLYVRVIELFASQLPQKAWYDFLDEYVKLGWIRDRMRHTVYRVVYGALHPDGVFERSSEVAALRAETFTYRDSFEDTTPAALISALARLDGMPGVDGILAVYVRGLEERIANQCSVGSWHDDLQREWDALRARLLRVSNSLAHGGPYTDEVIDALAGYTRDLARTVLNWGIDAMKAGQDIGAIAADRREAATTWASRIPTADSTPAALYGAAFRPHAAPAPAST